jgi:ferrous iron transport protein B
LFWSIFSFAEIPMGLIENALGACGSWVESKMAEGDLRSLMVEGVINGAGGVLVFLPQIILLFFFIGLLESSGYMARAAFLMDQVMAKAGLSGKAFLPLFGSYACAIPGIMATRTIDSAKERLVTIFVAPWMSCSARLPVFFLIIPMLLHEKEGTWKQALVLFGIYTLGTLSAFIVARILRGKLGPDKVVTHFMLELPSYRKPQWSYIFRHVLDRGWAFVRKAGTIILGLSILLWALENYPKSDSEDSAEVLAHSALGRIGNVIEPVFEPIGFDGRTGTAILTTFAAREVLVSSLRIIFNVEESDDEVETRDRIRAKMQEATRPDGRKLFTPLSLISLLVFFIYALQCLPTSAVVAREAGSWKWAVGQFAFMTCFAYLASLLVYQIGSLMGF